MRCLNFGSICLATGARRGLGRYFKSESSNLAAMAHVASLNFWEFVEERLNTSTRRRRGIVSLTDDTILANGVFANVVPELDPDTKRMYQLLVDRSTVVPRNERLFFVLRNIFENLLEKCSHVTLSPEVVLRVYGAFNCASHC